MGKNRRRNAKLGILPGFCVDPRGGQQQLARVNEVLFLRIALKTVPARARREAKEATFAGNRFGWVILPRAAIHHRRNKRLDHLAVRHNRLTRFNTQLNAFCPQTATTLPFVDFGVDIQRRKQRVKRAG